MLAAIALVAHAARAADLPETGTQGNGGVVWDKTTTTGEPDMSNQLLARNTTVVGEHSSGVAGSNAPQDEQGSRIDEPLTPAPVESTVVQTTNVVPEEITASDVEESTTTPGPENQNQKRKLETTTTPGPDFELGGTVIEGPNGEIIDTISVNGGASMGTGGSDSTYTNGKQSAILQQADANTREEGTSKGESAAAGVGGAALGFALCAMVAVAVVAARRHRTNNQDQDAQVEHGFTTNVVGAPNSFDNPHYEDAEYASVEYATATARVDGSHCGLGSRPLSTC